MNDENPAVHLFPRRGRRLLPGLSPRDGYTLHPFDVEFGVKTSGLIAGRHLVTGHAHDRQNTAYYGVAPSVLHKLVIRWQRTKPMAPIDQFTFIDIGAGMGRALLLAAEMPFRQVIGVELHPTLYRIARKNLTQWRLNGRAKAPMRIVCMDAVDLKPPEGPCVAFLFNPFGAKVMRRFLDSWGRQFAPRQLDVLYVNNEQERVLEQQPGYLRIFMGKIRRSREDAIADHTILANQPDGEYASANYEDCSIYRWVGMAAKR